jgi:hypothetical protein
VKRNSIPLILLITIIVLSTGYVTTRVYAQDFESITHPEDFIIKEDESASITWIVTITAVIDPKYDVYIDGNVYINNFTWVLNDGTGIITINVNESGPGSYNYVIFVRDGEGHQISDDVRVTIEAKTEVQRFFEEYWLWILIVTIFVGSMIGMVFIRRKGFKTGEGILDR